MKKYLLLLTVISLTACNGEADTKLPQSCEKVLRDYAALSDEAKAKLSHNRYGLGRFGGNFDGRTRGFDEMLEKSGGNVDASIEQWRKENDSYYASTTNSASKEEADLKMERRDQHCREWQSKLDAVK